MSSSFAQYVLDARRLRTSMRINLQDSYYVNAGNEIVYFVDANVVAMFANPMDHLSYLRPFSNWLDEKLIFGTLTITAEFLFSGRLPGQKTPTLITPDHFEDLHSMAGAIRKKAEHKALEVATRRFADQRSAIDRVIADYKRGVLTTEELLKLCTELLPQSMIEFLQGPVAEAAQLRRLLQQDKVTRYDTMSWFTQEAVELDSALVSEWAIRIRAAANRSRSSANVVRDARSVVQLLALSRDPPKNTRYVFITNDPAIRTAYLEYRRWEIGNGRRPVTLFLRRPREFAPLINLGSMSGNDKARLELFPQIQRALDELLRGVSVDDSVEEAPAEAEVRSSPAFIGLVAGSSNSQPKIQKQILSLQERWSQAASHALTLNAGYIGDRDRAHFGALVDVLAGDNVVDAALGQIRSVVDDLSFTHARYTIRGILQKFITVGRNRAMRVPEFGARRAPLVIKIELFRQFVGDISINEYLDKLMYNPATQVEGFDSKDGGISFLFAACVAIAAEDWLSARRFARSAIEQLEAQRTMNLEIFNEARYCYATALRFSLETDEDLETALDLLSSSETYYRARRDQIGWVRSVAETAAVLCVAAYKLRLVPEVRLHGKSSLKPHHLWRESREHLLSAQELLDDIETGSSSKDRVYARLGLQIYSISAALSIFAHWVEPNLMSETNTSTEKADLVELQRRISHWEKLKNTVETPYTAKVFVTVLEFILVTDVDTRRRVGLEAEELLHDLLIFEDELTDFDRAEYKLFLEKIESEMPAGN